MRALLLFLVLLGCATDADLMQDGPGTQDPDGKTDDACDDPSGELAAMQAWPSDLVLDDERVYWTTSDGTVAATARCGGAPIDVIATNQYTPRGIAVDSDSIYWVAYAGGSADGTVMKRARTGGAPVELTRARGPIAIALRVGHAYYLALDGVHRVPIDGGVAEPVAPAMCPVGGFTFAGADLVWSENCVMFGVPRIVKFSSATSALETLVEDAAPNDIAIAGDRAYWTSWSYPAGGRVNAVDLAGGAPEELATLDSYPGPIAADATHVYVQATEDLTIVSVPHAGGPTTLVDTSPALVPSLQVAGGVVYYASQGQAGSIRAALAP